MKIKDFFDYFNTNNEAIFSIQIADVPQKSQDKAKQMEAEYYGRQVNEKSYTNFFAISIHYDMNSKKIEVFNPTPQDFSNIYYIDNDGVAFGLKAELHDDFLKNIFQKCLNALYYTQTHCKTNADYKGKIVVMDNEAVREVKLISDPFFKRNHQLFYVTDVIGDRVLATMIDTPYGVHCTFKRKDIVGVIKKELVPKSLLEKAKKIKKDETQRKNDYER